MDSYDDKDVMKNDQVSLGQALPQPFLPSATEQETAPASEARMEDDPLHVTVKRRNWRKKVTWHKKEKWNFLEWMAAKDILPEEYYEPRPKNPNPPPERSAWLTRGWILAHAGPPLLIHALWYKLVPESTGLRTWHPAFAFVFYHLAFVVFALRMIKHMHHLTFKYGTFDEEHRGRDMVSDLGAQRLAASVIVYTLARTAGSLFLGGYDRNRPPSLGTEGTITWTFLPRMAAWCIVLDLIFYSYHRTCHESDFFWRVHADHHSSKHPTALQAILGSDAQELLEIFLMPLLTCLVVPMSPYEYWLTQTTLLYVEAMGHIGARVVLQHPVLGWFLRPLRMELILEDHDLHHRYGKSGRNYGKQSRIFDRLFGTCDERLESPN